MEQQLLNLQQCHPQQLCPASKSESKDKRVVFMCCDLSRVTQKKNDSHIPFSSSLESENLFLRR